MYLKRGLDYVFAEEMDDIDAPRCANCKTRAAAVRSERRWNGELRYKKYCAACARAVKLARNCEAYLRRRAREKASKITPTNHPQAKKIPAK